MVVPSRLVALEGAVNFRDLGGYPTRDGRATRSGQLFRSDTLHELTEGDVEILRGLGLVTVVDLRTPAELARTGRGRLAPEPIGYHHLSVLGDGSALADRMASEEGGDQAGSRPEEEAEARLAGREGTVGADGGPAGEPGESLAAPALAGDDLSARYRWYLDVGRQALVEAIELIADPSRLPLVFHCAAGKDRTGVLAALLLDILGVDQAAIVEDYLLTAGRMEMILDRYRGSDPEAAERIARLPPATYGVEAVTMRSFLDGIGAEFGGALGWAEQAGVGRATLERLPDLLLEPVGLLEP